MTIIQSGYELNYIVVDRMGLDQLDETDGIFEKVGFDQGANHPK